jgi:tripartite-type tricarboxylate transporter receptor subunit TctC
LRANAARSDIIAKLNRAVAAALTDPVTQQRFADLGQDPAASQQTADALATYHKDEIDKWWPIIKAANIESK